MLKFAMQNVKKNAALYKIYYIELIFSVAMFYMLNAFKNQPVIAENIGEGATGYKRLLANSIFYMITIFSIVIMAYLIFYANKYMLKKRSREFGVYSMLGMTNTKMEIMFGYEMLITGIISLILGVILGNLVFAAILAGLRKVIGTDSAVLAYNFSIKGIVSTVIGFCLIYVITLIKNVYWLRKQDTCAIMRNEHKNDCIVEVKFGKSCFEFVMAIAFFSFSVLVLSQKFMSLVYSASLEQMKFYIVMILLIMLTSVVLFFKSVSQTAYLIVKKIKPLYYKKLNIFILKQLMSNIKDNYRSMAFTCITLIMSITATVIGTVSWDNATDRLRENINSAEMPDMYSFDNDVTDALEENGIETDYVCKVREYSVGGFYTRKDENIVIDINSNVKNVTILSKYAEKLGVMSKSDYNMILEWNGYQGYEIDESQYAIVCNFARYKYKGDTDRDNFKKKMNGIDGKLFVGDTELEYVSVDDAKWLYPATDIATIIIVSDNCAEKIYESYPKIYEGEMDDNPQDFFTNTCTYIELTDKSREKLNDICRTDEDGEVYIDYKDNECFYSTSELYSRNLIRRFMDDNITFIFLCIGGMYSGVILFMAACLITAIHHISGMLDDIMSYVVLRKVGAADRDIKKAMFINSFIYIAVPYLAAIIVAGKVSLYMVNFLELNMVNEKVYIMCIYTFIIIFIVLAMYGKCKKMYIERKGSL